MILHITDVKYLHGFKIWVKFNDGNEGVADLEDSLFGPVFEPLKNLDYFAKVKVDPELDTIVWPNGADFAPEYIESKIISEPKKAII